MSKSENIIKIWDDIDDKLAIFVTDKLEHLYDKNIRHVTLSINSDGGSVESTISIIDTIEYFKNRGMVIDTLVCGRACSAAVNILITGSTRYATKNSFLMIHRGYYELSSDYDHVHKSTVSFWSDKVDSILELVIDTIKPKFKKQARAGMINGAWFSSNDALTIGLIDKIWT